MTRPLRLLTVAHSYVVAHYRRLAHEMQRAACGEWSVTAVAPACVYDNRRLVGLEADAAQDNRLEVVPVHLSRWVHCMVYGSRLRGILREGWDMVHYSEEPYVLMGGQVAWWTPPRIPLVFRTGQAVSKSYPPPFCWVERYGLERCAGWIGSSSVVETMLQRGYGRKPYRRIPLGVDLEAFRSDPLMGQAVRRGLGWEADGPPVVGYMGRFVPEKGLDLLTRVLARVESPWRALLVGEGPMEASLGRWARRYPQAARVIPRVGYGHAPSYFNAMDILCLPSQTAPHWRESFGRVLIESFACGVPVIGSDSGEIPAVIGDAGVVVGERDEEGWLRALSGLLESPDRRRELAARGLERARRFYAWPVLARAHLDFFEEILAAAKA